MPPASSGPVINSFVLLTLLLFFFYHFKVNWIGRVCVESLLTWVSWRKLLLLKIYTCEWFE